jgi:hypothetical protein
LPGSLSRHRFAAPADAVEQKDEVEVAGIGQGPPAKPAKRKHDQLAAFDTAVYRSEIPTNGVRKPTIAASAGRYTPPPRRWGRGAR